MAITKMDLIKNLNEQLAIPKKEAAGIVDSVFDIMKDELGQGKDVKISGFGRWKVNAKTKRRARNPQTGEAMTIDARKVVTFKPSGLLRDSVNAGK